MTDSLVLGSIELLGGGVPSTAPGAEGAYFRLGTGYSLGAPAWTAERVAGLLLGGEQLTSLRPSNRVISIPVVILVPAGSTADDRLTLSSARELLLGQAAREEWQLTWTRDGGLPLVFDCQGLNTNVVEYSILREQALVSLVEIEFEAYPFGHSDTAEPVLLPAPAQQFTQPPAPVTIDTFATVASAVDPALWSRSAVSAVSGQGSARWSRVWRQAPTYDRTLSGSVSIAGLTKLGLYAGFATTFDQLGTWYQGRVTFTVTLYDASGNSLNCQTTCWCVASVIASSPNWRYVSFAIPQVSGFDYAHLARYAVSAYNQWDALRQQNVMQAGFYLGQVQAVSTGLGNTTIRGLMATLPGIIGTAPAVCNIQAAPGTSAFSASALFTTAGTGNWLCPAGVTQVDKAEAWGPSGGGAGAQSTAPFGNRGGCGGGAGEYAMERNIPVTAGITYHPVVGGGGAAGAVGAAGSPGTGPSSFAGASGPVVTANPGQGGPTGSSTSNAPGGTGSVNYAHYPGGAGWNPGFGVLRGGGGGSSGGTASAGNDATDRPGAPAVADGGPGGDGGYSTAGTHAGQPGGGPGGGGGGGAYASPFPGPQPGAAGTAGQVRLTYGAAGILPLVSLLMHMPPEDEPLAYSPITAVGNGADTPNGATEYPVPAVSGLPARFDGTYNLWLIGSGTWGASTTARTVTITIRQYPFSGGTPVVSTILRTFTPSTDITNGWVDMGQVTLPLAALPPGNSAAYFTVAVTSGQTADRYLDVLLTSSEGQLILINGTGGWNNIWVDAPAASADLGGVYGSDADRDRAYSLAQQVDRWPGGPFRVVPGEHNRLFMYAAQGCPGATLTYLPSWVVDRLS